MRVLAVDPGVATGWALADDTCLGSDLVLRGQAEQFDFCEFAEIQINGTLVPRVDVVVCESYTVTPATIKLSRQYASLEIIGTLRYLADKYGRKFVLQTPAAAKRFMIDSRLKSLGWWSSSDHARDALRHLGLYLAENGNDTVLRA